MKSGGEKSGVKQKSGRIVAAGAISQQGSSFSEVQMFGALGQQGKIIIQYRMPYFLEELRRQNELPPEKIYVSA